MKLLCLVLVSLVALTNAYAVDLKVTGKNPRPQPENCPTPAASQVATQAAAPVEAPTLYSGGPGAPAQIGSTALVDVRSSVGEAEIKPVHYFQKAMKRETYQVQVPVEYSYKESYVEHVNVPVQKTGVTEQTKHIQVPVTKYRQVRTPVYDQCGRLCGYECKNVPYTAYENRAVKEQKTYQYTENQVEPRVKEREKTGVRYENGERERWIETTEVATKYVKFQTITTQYTVQQTSVSEVPASEVKSNP